MSLSMYCQSIEVSLGAGPDMCDITSQLQSVVRKSSVKEGQLSAAMVGSTGSLTTIEYEPGVVEDLKRAINLLAPPGIDYAHEAAWHDGNGHSHVQAALLGPSLVLPIRNGNLKTGTWQQPVAINHDNHPRQRTIEVTIIGAKGREQGA